MKKGKIMTTVAVILIIGLGYFKGMGIYSSSKKVNLGLKNEQLQECGKKPNCVSTTSTDEKHNVAPIKTSLPFDEVLNRLKEIKLTLISTENNYAHFTFESAIMGYIDDIEILYTKNELYIKSTSRVGYSDMGANRKRVELIRNILK